MAEATDMTIKADSWLTQTRIKECDGAMYCMNGVEIKDKNHVPGSRWEPEPPEYVCNLKCVKVGVSGECKSFKNKNMKEE